MDAMNTLPPYWSWSKLQLYRKCPLAARFKYVDHIPEPERPTADKGAERGLRIHAAMEAYLVNNASLPQEAETFRVQAEALRDLNPSVEQKTFFDSNWRPCKEENYWLIVIQDANVVTQDFALTVDFKTGKRFGNEASHMGQKLLYSITNWRLNDSLDEYIAEMWYLDQKDIWSTTFPVEQLAQSMARFDNEVDAMLNDTLFRPRANIHSCRFCPYSPRGNGHCPIGV